MIGIGIDLVEINKFRILYKKGDFLQRCFSPDELLEFGRTQDVQYLAGRFAAKEAVVKALGSGFINGYSFTDIEITRLNSGAPQVMLSNAVADAAHNMGISRWLVSITHTDHYANAVVVAE